MWKRKRSLSPTNPGHSHPGSKSDNYSNQLFLEKLALTAAGLWTGDMEISLKCVEIEEEKLNKEFAERRNRLKVTPDDHPKYAEEWTKFWKQKAIEVQKSGGDAEKYDYTPEWKEFWAQRVETLLAIEFEQKLDGIRAKHGMDLQSVSKIRQRGNSNGQNQKVVQSNAHPSVPVSLAAPAHAQATVGQFNDRDDIQDDRTSAWVAQMSSNHNNEFNEPGQGRSSRSSQGRTRKETNLVTVPVKSQPVEIEIQNEVKPSLNFTVIQILRRLGLLGEHLGSLAEQVQKYFETAQQMEVVRKGNSRNLYKDKEFLDMMLTCRTKLETLTFSKLYPEEDTDTFTDNIRNLNSILELPECKDLLEECPPAKKTRESPGPATPISISDQDDEEVEILQSDNSNSETSNQSQTQEEREVELSEAIIDSSSHLDMNQKIKLSELMATILTKEGREEINDFELLELTMKCIGPLVQLVEILHPSSSSEEVSSTEPVFSESEQQDDEVDVDVEAAVTADMWRRHELPREPQPQRRLTPVTQPVPVPQEPRPVSPELSPWAGYVASGEKRCTGIAILPLPTFTASAASPPYAGETVVHTQTVDRDLFGQNQGSMAP